VLLLEKRNEDVTFAALETLHKNGYNMEEALKHVSDWDLLQFRRNGTLKPLTNSSQRLLSMG
jgi:hypothetical protein